MTDELKDSFDSRIKNGVLRYRQTGQVSLRQFEINTHE